MASPDPVRAAQGVRVMNLNEGDEVQAVTVLPHAVAGILADGAASIDEES